MGVLLFYGIDKFQWEDIQKIYDVIQVPKFKGNGILIPRPGKIKEILERMAILNRVIIDLPYYRITEENSEDRQIYQNEIDRGYQKNYISGWIAYDKKNNMLN